MSKSKRVSSKRLISAASKNWLTEKNDDYYFDIKKYKRSIFIYDPRDLDCSPPPEVQLLQITSTSRETPQSIAINPLSILTQNEDGPLVGAGPSTPGNKKIDHIKNAEEPVIRWKKLKFSKDSYEEMFEKSFIKETFIPDVDAGEYTLIDLLNSLAKRLHLTFRERLRIRKTSRRGFNCGIITEKLKTTTSSKWLFQRNHMSSIMSSKSRIIFGSVPNIYWSGTHW